MHGEVTTDKAKISEVLNEHFVTIGEILAKQVHCSDTEPTVCVPKANSKFVFKTITNVQVLKILTKLVNGKATGLHGIPNKAIKSSATLITATLTYIFNISIKTRVSPWDFRLAKVTPVFKSGDRDELGNYRPISGIPTIAKVFEKLIYNQLHTYFIDNNLLGNEQYGFRSIHSTALALSRASNNWIINIENGSLNSVVFLDIQKAFDTVDHEIMLNKLRCYGVQEDELKVFVSHLDGRQQCTSVNGTMSSPREITCGVSQESILGPLLFIIYMNDLPLSVKEANICMLMIPVYLKLSGEYKI